MAATKKVSTTKKNDSEKRQTDDPCWKGYEQVGMKTKNGKKVPNCVPEQDKSQSE